MWRSLRKLCFFHLSVSHSVHGWGGIGEEGVVLHLGGLHPGGLLQRVCLEVCIREGVYLRWSASKGISQTPPPPDTTGYGQRAGGTHPTGIHSCCIFVPVSSNDCRSSSDKHCSLQSDLCPQRKQADSKNVVLSMKK